MSGAVIRPLRGEEPAVGGDGIIAGGGVVIRPMREKDLPRAARIERICFSSEAWSEKVYREEFAHAGTYLWLWCAVSEEVPEESAPRTAPGDPVGRDAPEESAPRIAPEESTVRTASEDPPGREASEGRTVRDAQDAGGAGIYRESGKPVGTISLTRTGDDGEIGNVAVLPEYRGKGIAKALLTQALEYGKHELGMTLFTLEVRAGNAAAIHLYESAGFRTEGLRPRFYTDPVEDALIMWKRK